MQRKFRLQKVLEHRERLVELAKAKLNDLIIKEKELKNKIDIIRLEIEKKTAEQFTAKQKGQLEFILMYDRYIDKLKKDFRTAAEIHSKALKAIEFQKKAVIKAINDHDVMLKLKNKHDINYTKYLDKEEMKMIDDLVTTRRGFSDE